VLRQLDPLPPPQTTDHCDPSFAVSSNPGNAINTHSTYFDPPDPRFDQALSKEVQVTDYYTRTAQLPAGSWRV